MKSILTNILRVAKFNGQSPERRLMEITPAIERLLAKLDKPASMENFKGHASFKAEATKLIGRTIVDVRYMDAGERKAMMWDSRTPPVLVLDSGDLIYPARDDEGNGGGALFGCGPNLGKSFALPQY